MYDNIDQNDASGASPMSMTEIRHAIKNNRLSYFAFAARDPELVCSGGTGKPEGKGSSSRVFCNEQGEQLPISRPSYSLLDRLIEICPGDRSESWKLYFQKALNARRCGDLRGAYLFSQQANLFQPYHHQLVCLHGDACCKIGKHAEALKALLPAVAFYPDSIELRSGVITACAGLQEYYLAASAAVAIIERVSPADRERYYETMAENLYLLARSGGGGGGDSSYPERESWNQVLLDAANRFPDNFFLNRQAAMAAAADQKWTDAESYAQRALRSSNCPPPLRAGEIHDRETVYILIIAIYNGGGSSKAVECSEWCEILLATGFREPVLEKIYLSSLRAGGMADLASRWESGEETRKQKEGPATMTLKAPPRPPPAHNHVRGREEEEEEPESF